MRLVEIVARSIASVWKSFFRPSRFLRRTSLVEINCSVIGIHWNIVLSMRSISSMNVPRRYIDRKSDMTLRGDLLLSAFVNDGCSDPCAERWRCLMDSRHSRDSRVNNCLLSAQQCGTLLPARFWMAGRSRQSTLNKSMHGRPRRRPA